MSIKPLALPEDGALTPSLVDSLRRSLGDDAALKAARNAASSNPLNELVLNREMLSSHDNFFSNRIATGKVTDQKKSARCWLFAALNILRPAMMKKYNLKNFEFSQNHLYFWDKMEKANLFLESVLATSDLDLRDRRVRFLLEDPIPDGGQWNYAVALIKKYGLVPREAMKETYNSNNSAAMLKILSTTLRRGAAGLRNEKLGGKDRAALLESKKRVLSDIYRLLSIFLGEPPERFEFRFEDRDGKTGPVRILTPVEFFSREVGAELDDYVCLYSNPVWDLNRLYQIDLDRNMADMPNITFANLRIEDLKAYVRASLLKNEPVWFGADVGKGADKKDGILSEKILGYEDLLGVDLSMTKSERIMYLDTQVSHAMVFLGVDLEGGKPVKWLVENSWGEDTGEKGFYAMYDDWFDQHVYEVVIKRRFLPREVLDLLKTEPVVLPEDDPMRAILR
jgi:bleomycin hydrolase